MNCKPGDLAMIVRNIEGGSPYQREVYALLIGRTVRVLQAGPNGFGFDTWSIEEPICVVFRRRGIRFVGVEDHTLMPISGIPVTDDVKDEVPA